MNALHCITEKSKRDDRGDVAVTHLLLRSMCLCARSVDAFYRVLSLTWIYKPYAHSIISKQGQPNVVYAGLHHGIHMIDGTLGRAQKVLTHMHQTVIADLWVSAKRLVSQLKTTL